MPSINYVTVDVFTTERFGGNPLAVILDARGLSSETMQRIAVEFNYSETTFVLPPTSPENSAQVRIFTPTCEVPFAGHPNVGTAFVLGTQGELFGKKLSDSIRFEELAGIVTVDILRDGSRVSGARIRAPRPLTTTDSVDPQVVAACASIDAKNVVTANHPPIMASVGLPFVLAELSDLDALANAAPNTTAFTEADAHHQHDANLRFSLFLYVRLTPDASRVRARMFAPLDNVPEDPATGSASAAFGAYMTSLRKETDLHTHLIIEQGVEMGRPSTIEVHTQKVGGTVSEVLVEGRCVPVMRGSLSI